MIRHAIWALALITLAACKKKSSHEAPGPGTPPPAITGKPFTTSKGAVAGNPTTAVINAAGGNLQTPDLNVSITVPAGAVNGNQTFSVQSVSNTLRPDKPLNAYRILPENVNFNKPVTVTLRYNARELTSGAEEMLMLAWQDNNGTWHPLPTTLNKINHTVSAQVTHFCDIAFYEQFELFAAKTRVQAGQELALRVGVQEISVNHDSLLAPLQHRIDDNGFGRAVARNYSMLHDKYAARATGWKVSSGPGEITVQKNPFNLDGNAVYKAPATVSAITDAEVEVTLEGLLGLKDPAAPNGTRKPEKLVLRKKFEVEPTGNATFMKIEVDYETVAIHAPQEPMYAVWDDGEVAVFETGAPNSVNCKLVLTKPLAGSWPCGAVEGNATEASVELHFDATRFALSQYCKMINGVSTAQYSTGKLTISKVGNAGEPIEGVFEGKVYKSTSPTECAFQVYHLKVTFRFLRFA